MELYSPASPEPAERSSSSLVGLGLIALIIALASALGGFLIAGGSITGLESGDFDDVLSWAQAARDVALAEVGESPALAPNPPTSPLPVCEKLSALQQRALDDAVALMRATIEGARLYDQLVEEGVCIGIAELDYNSAFAASRWSPVAGWSESEIRIDRSYVTVLYPDVLGAILVHEATHIDRAINRTACYYADTCTTLDNGVVLDEELAAHAAEAEWWISLYGRDGKDWAFAEDQSQNHLKAAWLRGPRDFREYVTRLRSNDREGEGI